MIKNIMMGIALSIALLSQSYANVSENHDSELSSILVELCLESDECLLDVIGYALEDSVNEMNRTIDENGNN